MSQEIFSVALKTVLTEIKNVCPDINWSFILMNNGLVIAGDEEATDPTIEKASGSFQTLAEKALAIGGLDNLLIDADKGNVYASRVNDMYLIAGLNKHANLSYFRNISQVILPTIIKVLGSINSSSVTPTPLKPVQFAPRFSSKPIYSEQIAEESEETEKTEETEEVVEAEEFEQPEQSESSESIESEVPEAESPKKPSALPSQQLIVDSFGGLLMRSDTVQIDDEILKRWSELLEVEEINEIEIETFSGRTARCKTKVINDSKLQGRGLIRIPEKTCQSLEIKRGELVRVKPIVLEE